MRVNVATKGLIYMPLVAVDRLSSREYSARIGQESR